jgi:uncharacterized protein
VEFEWDETKAAVNVEKHGVTFQEAATVFGDPLEATMPDLKHSDEEVRILSMGRSALERLLVVSYPERGSRIRITSAREATPRERRSDESSRHESSRPN